MGRLTHTPSGFRRAMQMSDTSVFIFVEGKKTDPYFYSKLATACAQMRALKFEIVKASTLDGSGGKSALIRYYQYLMANDSLMSRLQQKKTVAIFFLDKDIDDVTNKILYSNHVIYSEHHSVENYLFLEGSLCDSIAASCNFEPGRVETFMQNQRQWLREKAERWTDWISFCIYSHKFGLPGETNFRLNAS